jgi:hypothetical protein
MRIKAIIKKAKKELINKNMIMKSDNLLSIERLFIVTFLVCMLLVLASCVPTCPSSPDENLNAFGVSQEQVCRPYSPSFQPAEKLPFFKRSVTETQERITVTAAVLSNRESKEVFSRDLAKRDIQPVWLKIENNTDQRVAFLPVALDPGYYFPNEAAHMSKTKSEDLNRQIADYFNKRSMERVIPPGGVESGFVYTRKDPGVKYVNVMLYSPGIKKTFVFYLEVPGIKTDYGRVDFYSLYPENEIVDIEEEDELREALEKMPCCTTRKDGSGQNDPLNFIIIGDSGDVFSAFMRRGWDVTEPIYLGSGWKAFKAFFSHMRYRTSPMSSLFYFQRGQDIGLQKARSTIHERNHLRLWLTPYIFKGKNVWIGAISRDTGSYITTKTPWFTAHAIDPDLDEARSYLVQDLLFSQGVREFGYVLYTEPSTRQEPRWNFMEQPWWSDGRRAVFIFDSEPTALTELQLIPWAWDPQNTDLINESIRQRQERQKNK